ncbi:hypothetical protein NHX12_020197 [Muraenolepis orangiensis]|uniref:AXH domain-containing protein n=1 Tax=Muraenolepis orangiensis TaxID=630683 RepID=A0A9Q0EQX0_9TELE|nr:hypothetical protein NHX12_020197 [Muraenolepis orangiensis]
MDKAVNQSDGLLFCEERLLPTSDSHMEYDDLPALQEVRGECRAAVPVYQVEVGVSHLEREETSRGRGRRRTRKSSESKSAVSTRVSLSDDEDMGWSHSWPPTAWHCFLKGTRLRFHAGPRSAEWQDVENLGPGVLEDSADEDKAGSLKVYGLDGLCLTQHSEVVSSDQSVLQLTFDPGWSSFYPSLTVVHYGIPCYEVERGDVFLPPGHRDAVRTDASLVFATFRSYDFTPLDSSAVYVLSSMARRRRTSQSSGGAVSPDRDVPQDAQSPGPSHSTRQQPIKSPQSSSQPASSNATRCKRPMNAFMLFAKSTAGTEGVVVFEALAAEAQSSGKHSGKAQSTECSPRLT